MDLQSTTMVKTEVAKIFAP